VTVRFTDSHRQTNISFGSAPVTVTAPSLDMLSFQVLRRLCLFGVTTPVSHGGVIPACGLKTSTVNHSHEQPDPGIQLHKRHSL